MAIASAAVRNTGLLFADAGSPTISHLSIKNTWLKTRPKSYDDVKNSLILGYPNISNFHVFAFRNAGLIDRRIKVSFQPETGDVCDDRPGMLLDILFRHLFALLSSPDLQGAVVGRV
jgi:hypothetical protein